MKIWTQCAATGGNSVFKNWGKILDLVFPAKCPYCQCILDDAQECLCRSCELILPWISLENQIYPVKGTSGCISPLRYQDSVRDAICRYKFTPNPAYGVPFGTLIARCIRHHPDLEFDVVTWAPLSAKRRRQRGFDQAQLLAEAISKELKIPVHPMLKKVRHTVPQSSLSGASTRQENARDAYVSLDLAHFVGSRVLLVDDVMTTGATLQECGRILKLEGIGQIWCVTVARAAKKIEKTVEKG